MNLFRGLRNTRPCKQEVEMESVKRLRQAYSQAPWRHQLQVIVSFLLFLVIVALVAGVYLSVSAQTVAVGHEIQEMRRIVERVERSNADLESTLAHLTSRSVMEARAREMGFRPVQQAEIVYLEVPGYLVRGEAVLAPPPGLVVVEEITLSPAFTESLVDWVVENIWTPTGLLAEVLP
jgi:cell division protein FtsL